MALQQQQAARRVADQVAEIANAAVREKALRRRANAERAQRSAAVDKWLSKDRAVMIAFVIAAPVLAFLLVTNVMDVSLTKWAVPTPDRPVATRLAQEALDSVVKGVESYRSDYSRLPASLAAVGTPADGAWTYTPGGDRQYTITVKMLSQSLTFDSRTRVQPAQ